MAQSHGSGFYATREEAERDMVAPALDRERRLSGTTLPTNSKACVTGRAAPELVIRSPPENGTDPTTKRPMPPGAPPEALAMAR